MTQAAAEQQDPLGILIHDEIPAEKRRIKALAQSLVASQVAREISDTVLQLMQDGLRQLHERVQQLYGVVSEHAQQLDDVDERLDQLAPEGTAVTPEDAVKILNLADAFTVLAGELLEGRVPQIQDASVRDAIQQQIDNARDVRDLVNAAVLEPDSDDEGEDDGSEDEDDDDEVEPS